MEGRVVLCRVESGVEGGPVKGGEWSGGWSCEGWRVEGGWSCVGWRVKWRMVP